MSTPARKPALTLTKAPVREHPVAPEVPLGDTAGVDVIDPTMATRAAMTTGNPPARGMGTMTFRVDLDLRHKVKRYAVEHETAVQTVVAEALREYLENHAS